MIISTRSPTVSRVNRIQRPSSACEPLPPPPASATVWLERARDGEHLVVLDELLTPALYGDRGEWGVLLEQFHQQWFEPLMEALQRRDLALVRLYTGDGRMFEIKRSTLRRWWRRRKGWEAYFR